MMSSSSAIALAPAHPEATQDQPAPADEGHPQQENVALDKEIADQRERRNASSDRDEGATEPQTREDIKQHGIDRPKRSHLTRREMAEYAAAEYPEGEKNQQCRQYPQIERAHA